MKDFNFQLPTELDFGPGKIEVLGEKLDDQGVERVLVVTDKGIEEAGILETVESELTGKKYLIYDDVEANPKDRDVEEGAETARSFDPDCIIALGGGSSIDCAKGIGVLLSEDSDSIGDFYGSGLVRKDLPFFVAVPTTSGTGSEVTFSAVVTDTEFDRKMSVRSKKIAPDLALLDPELTVSLPKSLTAYSGMDAFTHAIEAYTAEPATVLTDSLALSSMELILDHLPTAVEEPRDLKSRSAMLLASTMAGIAFNHSDVASVHCMAEALGGKYDAPHGLCNSIILPYVMEYNKAHVKRKYSKIAELMGYDFETLEEGAEMAVEGIKGLNDELDIPSIEETGLKRDDIEELASTSVENLSNESNPRPMEREDYIKLFERMLGDDT